MNMNVYMPTKLITGKNCVLNNAIEFKKIGTKCLILTGKSSAKKCGALDDVLQALNEVEIQSVIFDQIGQNPKLTDCMEAAKFAQQNYVDFIIGIGGGSPLDAAKCVAVLAANENMTQAELYSLVWPNKPLPVVAVGTTAGTGSEVTKVSVITTPEGLKKSFNHVDVYPVVSFGDPKYTMTLSDTFTRSTAIDAFAHCMESYFTKIANDISQTYSVKGIQLLIDVFRKMDESYELTFDDRENLYNASIYGGLAIAVTGTCFPHGMGYLLTEQHGLPHGVACATYLPDFYAHNKAEMPELTEKFLKDIQCSEEELLSLIEKITPKYEVVMDMEEVESVRKRWPGNGSLTKAWGDFNEAKATALLIKKFVK